MSEQDDSAYSGYLKDPYTGARVEEEDAYIPLDRDGVRLYPVPQYDLSRLDSLPKRGSAAGIFRFQPLLPVEKTGVISLGEGDTALIPLTGLGADLDMHELYLKDESRNPTWSYKDRLAAVAVTKAAQQGLLEGMDAKEAALALALSEFHRSRGALRVAQARLELFGKTAGAVRRLKAGADRHITIASPISGTVVERQVGPGQVVKPDAPAPLFQISDLSDLWVHGDS